MENINTHQSFTTTQDADSNNYEVNEKVFTKKTKSTPLSIKIIVAIGIFIILFVCISIIFFLYSKEEFKKFIPNIIEYFVSAFSGIGLFCFCQKLTKWFKS